MCTCAYCGNYTFNLSFAMLKMEWTREEVLLVCDDFILSLSLSFKAPVAQTKRNSSLPETQEQDDEKKLTTCCENTSFVVVVLAGHAAAPRRCCRACVVCLSEHVVEQKTRGCKFSRVVCVLVRIAESRVIQFIVHCVQNGMVE